MLKPTDFALNIPAHQNDKIMPTLALRLIAENKKSKAARLDLGNCGLTALLFFFLYLTMGS